MIEKIDFKNTKPNFVNGDFKWYVDKQLQSYIETQQAENLPRLKGFGCFVVKNETDNVEDYVLIDSKQNVIDAYNYTREGYGQMEAKINIIKISKYYDKVEERNI